jgi:hypothetical protein
MKTLCVNMVERIDPPNIYQICKSRPKIIRNMGGKGIMIPPEENSNSLAIHIKRKRILMKCLIW